MYSRGTGWYLNRKPELNPEIKLNVAYPYRFITTLTIIDITSQFCNRQRSKPLHPLYPISAAPHVVFFPSNAPANMKALQKTLQNRLQ